MACDGDAAKAKSSAFGVVAFSANEVKDAGRRRDEDEETETHRRYEERHLTVRSVIGPNPD